MIVSFLNSAAAAEASGHTNRTSLENGTSQASQTVSARSYAEDTTSLTSASDSVQGLTATALAGDPARAARVQSLKQAVSQGQYSLEPEQIASALSSSEL